MIIIIKIRKLVNACVFARDGGRPVVETVSLTPLPPTPFAIKFPFTSSAPVDGSSQFLVDTLTMTIITTMGIARGKRIGHTV